MNFPLFIESLKYMLEGMLGIFIVMGVIFALIAVLTRTTAERK